MMRKPEVLAEAFSYDAETGTLLRRFKGGQTRVAGSRAGHGGYTKVGFNGQEYPAHRLIWWLVHGELPGAFIDHVNGDKGDNRLCNLRLATDGENKRNVGMRRHNTSGFKGVSFDKQTGRWLAHATFEGKGHHLAGIPPEKPPRMRTALSRQSTTANFSGSPHSGYVKMDRAQKRPAQC